jgi:putative transposase
MARLGRYFLEGQPLHVIQRGNNRQPIFFSHQDAVNFLGWLGEAAAEQGLKIHAYVLMPNHVHLLASPDHADSLPRTMQSLGRRYVRYINRLHQRTGSLWEGRYRAAVIDSENYLFRCSRYVEFNPVRAGLAPEPGSYKWSSYRANALGDSDALITPHTLFLGLGADGKARCAAYREAFADGVPVETLRAIREATNGGWALGNEDFRARMEGLSGRRSQPRPRGRPKREAAAAEVAPRGFLD